jgi:hypothetical protein
VVYPFLLAVLCYGLVLAFEAGSISGTLVPQVPVMQRADMVLFFLGMFAGTS